MDNSHTIEHFEIPVDDINRAQNFYKGLFGWEIKSAGPDFEEYLLINTGAGSVGGGMMKRSNADQQILNYITVDNIDESLEKLEKLGGNILMPKMPVTGIGWNAVVQDTENNTFGLFQREIPSPKYEGAE
ncbi:VOC family protein [Patescibacteria group bacterium]|nr:VOC family protein [Patescibacteria group bacterium]